MHQVITLGVNNVVAVSDNVTAMKLPLMTVVRLDYALYQIFKVTSILMKRCLKSSLSENQALVNRTVLALLFRCKIYRNLDGIPMLGSSITISYSQHHMLIDHEDSYLITDKCNPYIEASPSSDQTHQLQNP
ncbi:hypothetical protein CEXT_649021 [Caerostris extrusa]|uniref:Uncharacterized protein n=1 Tax=Caerostris extrusa TaxID=172846 RepID=A0AAV4XLG0_CAEEX|nr:hypothetical protein CEXT_649021 [Caerostris extrusa]